MRARTNTRISTLDSPRRRRLLKAAAASGLLAAVERNLALAQTAPDYKALVCINLQGGNDGENTLIRYDNAGYQAYAAIRTPASGINIPQAQLQPIQPASLGTPFGFHPACAPLKTLFNQKKLAVIANTGTLVQPSTKPGLETQDAPRPANLFSHNDQTLAAQSSDASGFTRVGWGGRIADLLDPANGGVLFPALMSMGGLATFATGRTSIPLTVPENARFPLQSSGTSQFQFDALRDAAMRQIVAQVRPNTYDDVAQLLAEEGLAASSVVLPIVQNRASVVPPFFFLLNSSIAVQLQTVAQLIEGRGQTQLKRQMFYVQQGGYDTHGNQAADQGSNLGDLAQAIDAFQKALSALGIANNVTTFTLAEFGRTFKPTNNGTDHGWGNYHFVIGDAVRGGDFYGKPAVQVLNGPDDFGGDGRWIPTTSIEQYGATLARWFGVAEADLPYVFPNIAAFPNSNLGFMG
jgi:uncharacterized protein (DUF1501 family)